MKIKKNMVTSVIAVVLILSLLAVGISLLHNNETASRNNMDIISEADMESLTFDEQIQNSTHIVEAAYEGKTKTDNLDTLLFKVVNTMKGKLSDEKIYVIAESGGEGSVAAYVKDDVYILFLERNVSLYYTNDRYVYLASSTKAKTDISYINDVLAKNPGNAPDQYGYIFTVSDKISEILDVSASIFEVEILSVFVESKYAPTTVYDCRVLSTVRNVPESGIIQIVFFNDTVQTGDHYIVLLADTEKGSTIYTLSSKSSVYTQSDAIEISELGKLLENKTEYTKEYDPKTDSEIYEEEQAAAMN